MFPLLLLACGGGVSSAETPAPRPAGAATASAPRASVTTPVLSNAAPDVLARMTPDLARCYAAGKEATATMTDGRVTLNGSLEPTGKLTCAIPSETTGLTQEVVDCMTARLEAEVFAPGDARTLAVPVTVKDGAIGPGTIASTVLESVETTRMPDAFQVLDAITPGLQECVRGVGATSLLLGAKIGTDGRALCALTRPSEGVPASVVGCALGVFRAAAFPAPKTSAVHPAARDGIVLVPITVVKGR